MEFISKDIITEFVNPCFVSRQLLNPENSSSSMNAKLISGFAKLQSMSRMVVQKRRRQTAL